MIENFKEEDDILGKMLIRLLELDGRIYTFLISVH